MPAAQADRRGEADDRLPRVDVVAAHQHVAIDRAVEVGQRMRRDVLERRDDAYPVPQFGLQRRDRRAALGQLDARDAGRPQRHGGVDEDLAGERIGDRQRGGALRRVRDGEQRERRPGGGLAIGGAAQRRAAQFRVQLGGGGRRAGGVARPDGYVVAGMREAQREAAALGAGSAERGEAHRRAHAARRERRAGGVVAAGASGAAAKERARRSAGGAP